MDSRVLIVIIKNIVPNSFGEINFVYKGNKRKEEPLIIKLENRYIEEFLANFDRYISLLIK